MDPSAHRVLLEASELTADSWKLLAEGSKPEADRSRLSATQEGIELRRTVIVHIANEDPMVAEIEDLPAPSDTSITVFNPRRKDGKPISYLTVGATAVVLPWHRITFVEVMPSAAERREVVDFFRER